VEYYTQSQRFASVPKAMPYTLILLTGDYPMVDFSLPAKAVLFFSLLVAVSVVAVPSGIIANGFVDALREQRARQKLDMRGAARVQACVRGVAVRRALQDGRLRRAVAQEAARRARSPWREAAAAMLCGGGGGGGGGLRARTAARGRHKAFERVTVALVLLSALAVVLESDAGVVEAAGGTQCFFDALELLVGLALTAALLLRLWAAELVGNAALSTATVVATGSVGWGAAARKYLSSFLGAADVLAVLPFWTQLLLAAGGLRSGGADAGFLVLRLLRVFQLEHFVLCFRLLGAVFDSCASVLRATGLLALCIWVGSATVFFCTERANPALTQQREFGGVSDTVPRFDSIPDSMYYVAIFMGGEWACMDFSKAGQALQVFLCVVGIALYAIPVGTLFEAFGDVLAAKAEEAVRQTRGTPAFTKKLSESEPRSEQARAGDATHAT
jgi:hypothetical protein